MKKEVIKEGDVVKILEPNVFVRVGYPFNLEYAKNNLVTEEEREMIGKLSRDICFIDQYTRNERTYNSILNAVAYKKLKDSGFGGNERKIFTKIDDTLDLEANYTVISKKMVRTGIYSHGSKGSYYPEDADPPTLYSCRNHQILQLGKIWEDDFLHFQEPLWIEKRFVVKV